MAKINYSKVEQMLQEALQKLQYKQLSEGKPIISSRAQEYYGITNEPRPVPEEVIEKLLDEEAAIEKERLEEALENERQQTEPQTSTEGPPEQPLKDSESAAAASFEPPTLPLSSENEFQESKELPILQATPKEESFSTSRKRVSAPPKRPMLPLDFSQTSEKFAEKASPLYLLRQHIFWMKLQHLENRYELLKTSKEEVFEWRTKRRLTEEDLVRIKTLLQKAQEFKAFWLKKKGMTSSDALIEQQQKKHRTKRFNIREKWLPI